MFEIFLFISHILGISLPIIVLIFPKVIYFAADKGMFLSFFAMSSYLYFSYTLHMRLVFAREYPMAFFDS